MSNNAIEGALNEFGLGLRLNTKALETLTKKLNDLSESVTSLGELFSSGATKVASFMGALASGMDATTRLAHSMNLSGRELDALGAVAAKNGISVEAMRDSLSSLSAHIGAAALGKGADAFAALGIEAKEANGKVKNVSTVLTEVADRFSTLGAEEKLAMAKNLGIDPSLIPLLDQGKQGFLALRDAALAANPLSEADYQQASRVTQGWQQAKESVSTYLNVLGARFLPLSGRVVESLSTWFSIATAGSNEGLISVFTRVATALETLWDWIDRAVTSLIKGVAWLMQFKGASDVLSAALALLIAYPLGLAINSMGGAFSKAATALSRFTAAFQLPTLLTGLFALGLFFLVDQLIRFYQGNDSLLTQLNSQYPGAIYGAWALLGLLGGGFIALKWQAIRSMLETMTMMGAYALDYLKMGARAALGFASVAWGWISTGATALANGAKMAMAWVIAMGPLGWVIAAVAAAVGVIWYYWDSISAWLASAWDGPMSLLKSCVEGALDVVTGLFLSAQAKVMGFIDMIGGAIKSVRNLLGLTDEAQALQVSVDNTPHAAPSGTSLSDALKSVPTLQGDWAAHPSAYPAAPFGDAAGRFSPAGSSLPSSGLLGNATGTVNNQTTTISVDAPHITVQTPDPARAGESVRSEMERMNQQTIRNGQSSVSY